MKNYYNMGLDKIKNIILIISLLFVAITSCKNENEKSELINENKHKKEVVKEELIFNKDSIVKKNFYKRVDEIKRDKENFYFKDFSLNFPFDIEQQKTLLVLSKENEKISFKLEDDFDLGEFNLWIYKLNKKYVFLLELDDYYDSIFYVYNFTGNCLVRLGDFSIPQPNVENEGIKKKSFKIFNKENNIQISTFLDKKLVSNLEMLIEDKCIPIVNSH